MPINLTAPVNSLGYGVVGLNLLLALDELGAEPALFPIGTPEAEPAHHAKLLEVMGRAQFYSAWSPSVRIWHQWDLAQHVGCGVHAAMPIFELDRFRPVELHHLRSQDVLLVNSQWAKRVVVTAGLQPYAVKVVPLGVNRQVFSPDPEQEEEGWSAPPGPTVFLNVGKWEVRKGHDVLLEAFSRAFEPEDNVELHLLCHNPCVDDRYNASWLSRARGGRLAGKVFAYETRLGSQQQVAELMRSADCGVFPARAEGWNLDAAEMLAMGKHLILTNYSGHTEWAAADSARLIAVNASEPAHDGVWFHKDRPDWQGEPGRWAALGPDQLDQLVAHLRAVHQLKQQGGLTFNLAGYERMKQFTWQNSAAALLEAFV